MKYYLEIKEPCHESWEKMSPTNKGKFCAACEKEVIDLTHFSDREVLSVLKNAKGNVCGRIQHQRLNYPIEIENSKPTFKNIKQLAASFLLLNFVLDSSELKAQSVTDTVIVKEDKIEKNNVLEKREDKKILRGTIKDDTTGEILIGATVQIGGTTIGASVDFPSDEFELEIPSYMTDSIELIFRYISSETKTVKLMVENLPAKMEIDLKIYNQLQGFIIVNSTPRQRIKNFFRRIFNSGYYD